MNLYLRWVLCVTLYGLKSILARWIVDSLYLTHHAKDKYNFSLHNEPYLCSGIVKEDGKMKASENVSFSFFPTSSSP